MFKTLKNIWQEITQKGKIFPYQMAFTLLIPLRNWALSPQQIAQRLHFVPHPRICCGAGYFSCVGWASAHRFFIFGCRLVGKAHPMVNTVTDSFPPASESRRTTKNARPMRQPLPTSGAMRQNGNMPIQIRHPPPACFYIIRKFIVD